MGTAERLVAAYRTAWDRRTATGDAAPAVLRAEIDRAVETEGRVATEEQELVELLVRAWEKATPPGRLWRPLLGAQVRSTLTLVTQTVNLLRTPKEFKRPRGLIEVDDARDDEESDFGVVTALPFHAGATTPDVLAWAWSIADDGDDPEVDVPVWIDVVDGAGAAVVMVGAVRAGTSAAPAGTYEALRALDRRRKRCILDGTLELRRREGGQVEVAELTTELP